MPVTLLTETEMVELHGVHWRSLPLVYGSGAIDGGTIDEMVEHHKALAMKFAPEVVFVSPLRGKDLDDMQVVRAEEIKHDMCSGPWCTTNREIITRDLVDVHRAKVLLVNLKANRRKMRLLRDRHNGDVSVADLSHPFMSTQESIGEIEVEHPLTGTVVEAYEAWRSGIPVVGYNVHKACKQFASPWMNFWVTRAFEGVDDAVAYIKAVHWL